MLRDIVVFERQSEEGTFELDFRLLRGALPAGACPLAIADRHGFAVSEGQGFLAQEVACFAEEQSGYRSEIYQERLRVELTEKELEAAVRAAIEAQPDLRPNEVLDALDYDANGSLGLSGPFAVKISEEAFQAAQRALRALGRAA